MPIVAADVETRFSGGTTNTSAAASLGGAMSTAAGGAWASGVKNNLFDDIAPAEATAGDTEYRGYYVKNNHATLTWGDARVYINADSAHAGDLIDIALADEAVSTTIETIADESTAPVGPVFTHPTTYAGGLQLNAATGLAAQAYKGVWVKRVISSGAGAGSVTNTLRHEGTTA